MKPEELGLNATFKQKFEHFYLTFTIQNRLTSAQELVPARFDIKLGHNLSPENVLATANEYLSGTREGKLAAQISADPHNWRKSKVSLRASSKISRTIESTVRLGLSENEYQLAIETAFEFKFGLGASKVTGGGSQARLYVGWSNSLEGGRFVFGMKIAGVKFKFPIQIIDNTSTPTDILESFFEFAVVHLGVRWYT